jgi:hypothetical protein
MERKRMDEFQGAWTVLEFARRHGIGRNTVFNEIGAGRLVARRAGVKKIVITSEDAADWRRSLPRVVTDNAAVA